MLFQLAKCLAFFVARGVVISIASRCYSNGREQGDPVERRGERGQERARAAADAVKVVISIASRCYSNPSCKLSKTTSAYSRYCERYLTVRI